MGCDHILSCCCKINSPTQVRKWEATSSLQQEVKVFRDGNAVCGGCGLTDRMSLIKIVILLEWMSSLIAQQWRSWGVGDWFYWCVIRTWSRKMLEENTHSANPYWANKDLNVSERCWTPAHCQFVKKVTFLARTFLTDGKLSEFLTLNSLKRWCDFMSWTLGTYCFNWSRKQRLSEEKIGTTTNINKRTLVLKVCTFINIL